MRIGVDAGCLGVKDDRLKVGVYNFARNLLLQLAQIETENEYFLYSFSPINKALMRKLGPRMKNIVVRPNKGWLTIWLPIRMVRDRIDIFLALSQAIPPRMSPTTRIIGFVHDIAFEKSPNFYSDSFESLRQNTKNIVNKSDYIITFSNATKKDLKEYYKAPLSKVVIIPQGVRSLKASKNKQQNSKKQYFLYVGALKKGKNVPTVIKAFNEFVNKSRKDYELFIVGGDKWLDAEIQDTLLTIPEETLEKIIFIGYVEDDELASLYKNATAFVSPSFHEGFGLPFVEAMAAGCPVIGSDRGSLSEVVGDAGILVDPTNVQAIAQAMEQMANNTKLRDEYVQKGLAKSKEYSWDKTAEEIFKLISSFSHA